MYLIQCMLLLPSEIPSGMCAKLHSVAARNNRDHARNLSSRTLVVMFNRSHVNIGRATMLQSLLLLLARATHMMVLFFTHTPFVVNHTINATLLERLQHYLHHMTIWDVYFKVCKVVNMSVSMSKLSFYTDVNPCNQKKKHPTKQNISLVREEDIKMLALQSKI